MCGSRSSRLDQLPSAVHHDHPNVFICPDHGYISGEHPECPQCGATTEMWTRVMGYFRPVQSFNTGKKGEFHERTYFAEALI
ncbi:anaerobic ribonucleoside triphosphate reductase [Corynebacterium diphtheriae str. Aberdeen]|nr:anaerobic ribonucleoside triphosphate reductase [Corynebacterium diphtheriae str. Aberdeen]